MWSCLCLALIHFHWIDWYHCQTIQDRATWIDVYQFYNRYHLICCQSFQLLVGFPVYQIPNRGDIRFNIQPSWMNTAPKESHIYCLSIVDLSTTSVSNFLAFIKTQTVYFEFHAKSISHLWLVMKVDKYGLIYWSFHQL